MKILSVALTLFLLHSALHGQLSSSPPKIASDTTRYAVLIMEKPAGAQTSMTTPEGVWEYFFEYNDRGRGPRLTSRITLDTDGIPTRIETTGHDYLKSPVDERFSLRGGEATWKNRGEQGKKSLSGKAFYVSMSGVPEESALLAQALLAAPGGKLPLLPEGEARIERVGELKVQAKG